jgi:hypothetical protein
MESIIFFKESFAVYMEEMNIREEFDRIERKIDKVRKLIR